MDVSYQPLESPDSPKPLQDVLIQACISNALLTAFTCEGAELTFRELAELSDKFAAWLLRDSTLVPGDRVAIQMPNLLQYPVAVLGVIKAGMVVVNINPLYTAGETEFQLRDSGARVLLILEDVLPVTSRILRNTSVEKVIVTGAADLHPWHLGSLYRIRKFISNRNREPFVFSGKMTFGRVLRRGKKLLDQFSNQVFENEATPGADGKDIAVIQYTGGTTGKAKGAMLTHDNLIANLKQVDSVIASRDTPPGSIVVAPLPFYHIYAFTMNLLYSIYRGYHGVLIPDPRNTDRLVQAIRHMKIRGFVGVGTLFHVLCKHPEFRELDFSHLTVCTSGGMALSVSTARRWEKLTGCRILEGYGLTETSPLVASGKYEDYREGKIGKNTLWTELRIVDEDGKPLSAGLAGEIQVRGPQVMMGYWNKPEETRAVLSEDGWLKTGDIGILDEDGYLAVIDRIKDLILVSGFNVYPAEVEAHASSHPDIREVAAIGVPVEEGEYVKLFVISDNPDLTEDEVIQFCRQGLTPYKVPRKVEFRSALPRSNIGKVLRRQLRDDQLA